MQYYFLLILLISYSFIFSTPYHIVDINENQIYTKLKSGKTPHAFSLGFIQRGTELGSGVEFSAFIFPKNNKYNPLRFSGGYLWISERDNSNGYKNYINTIEIIDISDDIKMGEFRQYKGFGAGLNFTTPIYRKSFLIHEIGVLGLEKIYRESYYDTLNNNSDSTYGAYYIESGKEKESFNAIEVGMKTCYKFKENSSLGIYIGFKILLWENDKSPYNHQKRPLYGSSTFNITMGLLVFDPIKIIDTIFLHPPPSP